VGGCAAQAVFEKSSTPELGLTFWHSEKSPKSQGSFYCFRNKVQKVRVHFSVFKIKFKKLELKFRFFQKS
jgi:hypothetical protein